MSKLAYLKRLGPMQILFLLLALIPLTGLPLSEEAPGGQATHAEE